MNARIPVVASAALLAAALTSASAVAEQSPVLAHAYGGGALSLRADMFAAGIPEAHRGVVTRGDYDQDGDQDIVQVLREGSEVRSRVYRNDGGGVLTGIASCTTIGDVTVCNGDLSAGVHLDVTANSAVLRVIELTAHIAPAEGVPGIEMSSASGSDLKAEFMGGAWRITTFGDEASGIVVESVGPNGANGGNTIVTAGGTGQPGTPGGRVIVDSRGDIATDGIEAHGILAVSEGGRGGNGGNSTFANGGSAGKGGDGDSVTVTGTGTIETKGDTSHGILAVSEGGRGGNGGSSGVFGEGKNGGWGGKGGAVIVDGNWSITTRGFESHGIAAQSLGGGGGTAGNGSFFNPDPGTGGASGHGGSVLVMGRGSIHTLGDESHGIFAQSVGGHAGAGGGANSIVNFSANGGSGGDGGTVTVANEAGITTGGAGSHAIFGQSVGGGGGSGGSGFGLFYSSGGGGSAGGDGGTVLVQNSATLTTTGVDARGIFAQSIGGGGGNGGSSGGIASFGGAGATTSDGGSVSVVNSGAITTGVPAPDEGRPQPLTGSQAIFAQSIGGGGGNGGQSGGWFSIGGRGGGGGNAGDVTVRNTGRLTTYDDNSSAIFAQSVGGGGGNGGGSISAGLYASLAIGGKGGKGGTGGDVLVEALEGSILTAGDRSSGIHAQSVGGGGGNGGYAASMAVGKEFAAALAFGGIGGAGNEGGTVDVIAGADITTTGDRSHGIFAESVGGGGGSGGMSVALSGSPGPSLSMSFGGPGGAGSDADSVRVTSTGQIHTSGFGSYGIMAQSVGGGGGDGGGAIGGSASGKLAMTATFGGGAGSGGRGSHVFVENQGRIETTGGESHGIFAQSVGGGGGSGGFSAGLSASVENSLKLSFGGAGGTGKSGGTVAVLNAGAVTTTGDRSYGILAQSVGGGGGSGGANYGLNGVTVKNELSLAIGGKGGQGGDGSTVAVHNAGTIETGGIQSHGVFAQSVGGGGGDGGNNLSIIVPKPKPSTAAGEDVRGLHVSAAGQDGGSDATEASKTLTLKVDIGGSGGAAGNGGAVQVVNSGEITTTKSLSNGIFAQSVGGGGGSGGTNLSIQIPSIPGGPKDSTSLALNLTIGGRGDAGGDGGTVGVANDGAIETAGDLSHGIFAQSVGGGGGSQLVEVDNPLSDAGPYLQPKGIGITIGGSGGASGNGGAVSVANDGGILTKGASSHGIFAQSVGGGGGQGAEADAGLTGAFSVGGTGGASGHGGTVSLDNSGAITTWGEASHGIFAQSVGGGGGVGGDVKRGLGSLNVGIGIGIGGDGTNAGNGGAVNVRSTGDIATHGANSIGIFAQSVGGGGGTGGGAGNWNQPALFSFAGSSGGAGSGGDVAVAQAGRLTTDGAAAHGIFAQSAGGTAGGNDRGGDVAVAVRGQVLVGGADAHGVFAQSIGSEGNGSIEVTVAKDATVQGGSGEGAGVFMLDGSQNRLENRGTVTNVHGIDGYAVRGTSGHDLIENHGLMIGMVDLGGGVNTFDNIAGGRFESGTLVDLGGGVLVNEGVFSPGGICATTTTLHGDYIQAETGTFEVTVCGDALDRLIVLDGEAWLDGTLEIVADHEAYLDGTTYDILEVSAIHGSFDEIVLPHTAFLDFEVAPIGAGGIEVSVDVTCFGDAARNPLDRAIAGTLDGCLGHASGDMSHMIGQFQLASASEVAEGFFSLGPGTYDNLTRGALQSTRLHQDALRYRMESARGRPSPAFEAPTGRSYEGGHGWWMSGAHLGADQDASGGFLEQNITTSGALAGYERASGRAILGASFGATRATVDLSNDHADGSTDGYLASLYGGRIFGAAFAQGVVTYAMNQFENRRDVHVGAESRVARSDYDGSTLSALVESGRRWKAGSWGIEPFASLRYERLSEDAFTEEGAGSVNLVVEDRSTDWLGSDVGIRFTRSIMRERSAFLPEFHAAWNHDFGLSDREITATFEADPDMPFTVAGQDVDRDGVTAGVGFTYQTVRGWSATVRYDRVQRGDYRANGFLLRVGAGF